MFRMAARAHSTVFALATAHTAQPAGVAVVRISGPGALQVLGALTRTAPVALPPRALTAVKLLNPRNPTDVLDRALAAYFPRPRSFTGEDVVELHLHGGPAVVRNVLEVLADQPMARLAQPGEFTRRAFENGKLDLLQVEALADLIGADTEVQRRLAMRQLEGHASALYESWRTRLRNVMAHYEAVIDFGEDANLEDALATQAHRQSATLRQEIQQHLTDGRRGEIIRSGISITIFGKPNVGKSTLLNTLAQRPIAITSPHAGTTRDVVTTTLNLHGIPVVLSDTAGLRASSDFAEAEGVRRATAHALGSVLQLCVVDATSLSGSALSPSCRSPLPV
eukprot:TRINITY_DN8086_c0_g1_i1.p1 TRINITY_DN8086_c0_g1~~TRINITY_DN8086_c0_g1_i1.p1  ORF type:complete len:337 (-),score=34.03 TRINITY_DN8086_c0_g1_i1:26-1036(-)